MKAGGGSCSTAVNGWAIRAVVSLAVLGATDCQIAMSEVGRLYPLLADQQSRFLIILKGKLLLEAGPTCFPNIRFL
jgi:hypothetical protein